MNEGFVKASKKEGNMPFLAQLKTNGRNQKVMY